MSIIECNKSRKSALEDDSTAISVRLKTEKATVHLQDINTWHQCANLRVTCFTVERRGVVARKLDWLSDQRRFQPRQEYT